MTEFTPISSLVGGMLIGTASALLLIFNGRIAGISGIVGGLAHAVGGDRGWRVAFLLGLLGGGVLLGTLMPSAFGMTPTSTPWLILAGLTVGFGTRMGSGCTSGHGVCGLSRFSPRSIVATGTFMIVAGITVFIAHSGRGF